MSNPFASDQEHTAEQPTEEQELAELHELTEEQELEAAVDEPDADIDVDAGEDDETDEVEEVPAGKTVKAKKADSTSTRPPVPEGYVSPVTAAKKLGTHLTSRARAAGKIKDDEEIEIRPQVVYSYIRNSKGGKNPIPTYEAGGRKNLLKLEEFLAWWDAKDERVAASKVRAAEKAAKKTEKAAEKTEEVTEAEGAEATEAVEAE
jgi:hypothetical protein